MKSNAGEVIKALHRESGITQKSVAEKLGISNQAYDSYMTHEVRFDTFLKIVEELGYHLEVRKGALGYVAIRGDSCEDCVYKKTANADVVLDFYKDEREEFDARKVVKRRGNVNG